MPGATASDAVHFAEKLRKAIEDCQIPHDWNSAAPVVTISVGVAFHIPTNTNKPGELLAAADAMLYQAKQAGRNRSLARNINATMTSTT